MRDRRCRSGAARANRPKYCGLFQPAPMGRALACTYALRRYGLTPAAVDCLSCPVCARTRSPSPSAPRLPWKRCVLSVIRACTGRVPVRTHACDFRDLADSTVRRKLRRKADPLAGILELVSYGRSRRSRPLADRERLFHDSSGATRLHRRGAAAGLHAQGHEPRRVSALVRWSTEHTDVCSGGSAAGVAVPWGTQTDRRTTGCARA